MKTLVVVAVLVLAVGQAFADNIHIGGNETHNVTNQGGQGGEGGTGIGIGKASSYSGASSSSKSSSEAEVTNVNVVAPSIKNRQGQDQGQDQSQKQKQNQDLTNQPNQVIHGDSYYSKNEAYASAPDATAPALTAAPETCMGSTSAGGSGGNGIFGFGLSFGTTWKSEDCELRMFARSLASLGQHTAALHLLAQNEKVAQALVHSGVRLRKATSAVTPGETPSERFHRIPLMTIPQPAALTPSNISRDPAQVACKNSEHKIRAGNGEYFCQAN